MSVTRRVATRGIAVAIGAVALCVTASDARAQDARMSTVDLAQTQLTVPTKVTVGKRFVVLDTVENLGDTSSPLTVTGFCLAKTDVCTATDLKVAARRVPALMGGAQHSSESPMTLPDTVEPGSYFIVVTANANNDVQERSRVNNVRAAPVEVEGKKKK